MHILIAEAFDAKLPERLAPFGQVSSDMTALGQADVLLVRSKTKVNADLLAQAPALKLVIRGGVGMDNVDKKLCAEKGVKAVNTPRASSVAVAEMAMAFMVAIPARLIEAHTSMKEGKFLKSELKRTELFKKTLGLIGAGNIGGAIARGLVNAQFIVRDDGVYLIEVNPRASRTVPFLSKVTGVPMVELAVRIGLGATLSQLGWPGGLMPPPALVAVKAPAFSTATTSSSSPFPRLRK